MSLKAISFKVAWDGNERFTHFINATGEIAIVDKDAEIVKVCVMANSVSEVTEEQRDAVEALANLATQQNPLVCLTFGAGLSPFYIHPTILELGASAYCETSPS